MTDHVEIKLWQTPPEPNSFGLCYECKDGLHKDCLGIPCACECPAPADRCHPYPNLVFEAGLEDREFYRRLDEEYC